VNTNPDRSPNKEPQTMPHVNVAFLGPEGTFSHEACIKRFGARFTPRPCHTLREVFEALAGTDAAVVPVENSIEGPVTPTLDLLAQRTNVRVQESFGIPIHNHLAARATITGLNAVKVVYSHPQPLGQCEQWLHRHLPLADLVPVASTSEAARRASKESHAAAVAGETAIAIHKLRILSENIQDTETNATRFLLLTPPDGPRIALPPSKISGTPQNRTLLHLILHNRPGALLAALAPFEKNGVDLTFIQSRPLPGQAWDYGFFIEADADEKSPALKRTLKLLAEQTQVCRLISSYICYGLSSGKSRRV